MVLRFKVVLKDEVETDVLRSSSSSECMHFELELRRRSSTATTKRVDSYREKLLIACLSFNFEEFLRYLRKVI